MPSAKSIRGALVLAFILAIGAVTSPATHANPVVTLSVTVYKDAALTMVAGTETLTENTAADGSYSTGPLANFFGVILNLSGSTNSPGSATVGQLLSNEVDAKALPSGEDRWVQVVATTGAFSQPGSNGALVQVLSSVSSDLNPANVVFSTSFNSTSLGNQTPTSTANTVTQDFTRGASYTLSNTAIIYVTPTGSTVHVDSTGTSQVTALPEPSTLAMAAFGLPMLGLAAWRRRKAARA